MQTATHWEQALSVQTATHWEQALSQTYTLRTGVIGDCYTLRTGVIADRYTLRTGCRRVDTATEMSTEVRPADCLLITCRCQAWDWGKGGVLDDTTEWDIHVLNTTSDTTHCSDIHVLNTTADTIACSDVHVLNTTSDTTACTDIHVLNTTQIWCNSSGSCGFSTPS